MPKIDPRWVRNPSDELAIARGCYFDEDAGSAACEFVETFCCQSKGKWGGEPLTLLPWQRDFLMRLFGWKLPDGRRRFRRAYLEVAKKNGKSTLISAITLFLLLADGEAGPEVYLNACNRDQARIVFDEAARMVRASADLMGRLEIVDSKHRIVCEANNGVIRVNSADAPSKDGLNPSGVIFDELHRQPDSRLWDIFEHADSAREQPLTVSITTAGEDTTGVWYEQREHSEKVNRGEVPDITHLGVIYRAEPEDDLDDPATWRKANPSLGATLTEENFRLKLADARETPRKLADFLRLRLNIITNADAAFIDPAAWDACNTPVDAGSLRGESCYGGLDLASTTDLTALALIFGDAEAGYDVLMRFWLPKDNVKELSRRDRVDYGFWHRAGFLKLTPGNAVDYSFVRKEVNDLAATHDLRMLAADPYNADQLLIDLEQSDGLPVAKIRQGFLSLSAPTKELERLVLTRKLRHGGHPILRWNAANAVADTDAAGNVKLSKKKSRLKIDGMAALVNAIAALTEDPDGGASVYATRGILTL